MKLILLCLLIISCSSVVARDCESEGNMGAIRACLEEEAMKPVDAAYDDLLLSLHDHAEAKEAIEIAQNDWKKFRDSICHYSAVTYEYEDIGYASDARTNCISEFNSARVKILKMYKKSASKNHNN